MIAPDAPILIDSAITNKKTTNESEFSMIVLALLSPTIYFIVRKKIGMAVVTVALFWVGLLLFFFVVPLVLFWIAARVLSVKHLMNERRRKESVRLTEYGAKLVGEEVGATSSGTGRRSSNRLIHMQDECTLLTPRSPSQRLRGVFLFSDYNKHRALSADRQLMDRLRVIRSL